MILDVSCNDYALMPLLKVFKNVIDIIHIIGPVLALVSLGILSFKMVTDSSMNNKDKNLKGIRNSLVALAVLFFLPLLINLVMYIVGDNFRVTKCWNTIDTVTFTSKSEFKGHEFVDEDGDGIDDVTGKSIQKVYVEPGDYERGSTGINPNKGYCPRFVEPNNTVKSSFDAETMGIIEKHLNDFDYSTFSSANAPSYIRSLGGVFSKYYGRDVQVTTAGEFQEVAEYVFGLMYLYGFDYYNGRGSNGHYCKWGGSCLYYEKEGTSQGTGTSDAFYPGSMRNDGGGLSGPKSDFDKLITGANGVNMTTNCNWTVDMVYYKAGLFGGNGQPTSSASFKSLGRNYEIISNIEDLQVGDIVHFFHNPIDPKNPDSWGGWFHVAFIGEVDKKKGTVTGFDGGSYYQQGRNYKWVSEISKGKVYGHEQNRWVGIRITNLTQNCG